MVVWEVQVRGCGRGGNCKRLGKIEPCLKKQNKPCSLFFFFVFKISCPGVFLPGKQDVYLAVYLLNQYLETDCFPSVFPIMIQQNMRFEKVNVTFSLLNREQILLSEDRLMVHVKNTVLIKLFCKFPLKENYLKAPQHSAKP